MAVVRRSRTLAAAPEQLWRTVGDPYQLARWWPKVLRVEAVEGGRFTEVLQTDRGRDVRADWRVEEVVDHVRWSAAQEVDGTPFERVIASARKSVELAPADGGTTVTIALDRRLRGLSRLGGVFLRRAGTIQLDAALDALEQAHGRV
jgi:uncharacterized protein YndB with AHSA1/START domain